MSTCVAVFEWTANSNLLIEQAPAVHKCRLGKSRDSGYIDYHPQYVVLATLGVIRIEAPAPDAAADSGYDRQIIATKCSRLLRHSWPLTPTSTSTS